MEVRDRWLILTAQILGQEKLETGAPWPTPRHTRSALFPILCPWARVAPLSAHRISSLHPPSSPTASHFPFHQLPHSHICFSLLSLHNPLLTPSSHPGFSCPFISPFPEFSSTEVASSRGQELQKDIKAGLPHQRPGSARSTPLDCLPDRPEFHISAPQGAHFQPAPQPFHCA